MYTIIIISIPETVIKSEPVNDMAYFVTLLRVGMNMKTKIVRYSRCVILILF